MSAHSKRGTPTPSDGMLGPVTGAHVGRTNLPVVQTGALVLWLGLALIPGSLWRVPDAAIDVLFPCALAALCGAGIVTLIRKRRGDLALITGTALCATGLLLSAAVIALVPTCLPDF
jgi:hypothetical protein